MVEDVQDESLGYASRVAQSPWKDCSTPCSLTTPISSRTRAPSSGGGSGRLSSCSSQVDEPSEAGSPRTVHRARRDRRSVGHADTVAANQTDLRPQGSKGIAGLALGGLAAMPFLEAPLPSQVQHAQQAQQGRQARLARPPSAAQADRSLEVAKLLLPPQFQGTQLNPHLVAKKRPLRSDNSLRTFDPTMPLKKRPTPSLLSDAPLFGL